MSVNRHAATGFIFVTVLLDMLAVGGDYPSYNKDDLH